MADTEHDGGFASVHMWSWRRTLMRSSLPSTTKHVLLTLSMHASEAGDGIFPKVKTLAEETSLRPETVKDHLRSAADVGWIAKEQRFTESGRQTSNAYVLLVPKGEGGAKRPPPGETHGGRGVPNAPLGGGGKRPPQEERLKGKSQKEGTDLFGDVPSPNGNGKKKKSKLKRRPDYTPEFEEAWAVLRRGSKPDAFEMYEAAVPSEVSHDDLVRALRMYVKSFDPGFKGAHLVLWIRDRRWEEQLEASPAAAAFDDVEERAIGAEFDPQRGW